MARQIRLDLPVMAAVHYLPYGDRWVPACGGQEVPFKSRSGATLLYCWNPKTGEHAYLNCDTDLILSDEEAHTLMWGVQ
jgi:hypothetical protein